MTRRRSLRSNLYRAARILGDVEAVQRDGAEGLAKREARRAVYREEGRLTNRLLRAVGLMGPRRTR
ncbi:hypothetical protein [Sinomonas soli]